MGSLRDESYVNTLEHIVRQLLTPLKDIPFNLVIEALTGKKVIPFDQDDPEHRQVLEKLTNAALAAGKAINSEGISRSRPNEVGNDVEKFVMRELEKQGLKPSRPHGRSGHKKSTGYPDILFWYNSKPYYLECKTYGTGKGDQTYRTFYLSPSSDFKVIYDAPHLVIAYETHKDSTQQGPTYKCRRFKILAIEGLRMDVKYEFFSTNKRLYSSKGTSVLAEGEIES